MDVKKMIEDLIKKAKEDPKFLEELDKNPVKVIEKTFGVDLPDEKINAVVDGVKSKLKLDDAISGLSGLGDIGEKISDLLGGDKK